MTNGNQQLYLSKRYWALANFSRYVRPGDVRHQVHDLPPNLRALAFHSGQSWVLVGINNAAPGSTPSEVRIQLPVEQAVTLMSAVALETSADRNLERVSDPVLDANGLLSTKLPAQSVTTLVISA